MNFSISPPKLRESSGRRSTPVGVEDGRDLGRRRPLGEAGEADEVAEEDADLLPALAGARQVESAEPLVPPLTTGGEPDDQVSEDDQAVPLPPASVPLALPGDRHSDHRLGQQQEAGDHGGREQGRAVTEELPVARGADRVDRRPDDRKGGEHGPGRSLVVRPRQRRETGQRPGEPDGHGGQDGAAKLRPVAHHPPPELGPPVHERGARGEEGAHEQPDRDRDLEPGAALREEDADGAEGMEAHEAAGGHERERQEQHPRVAAAVGRLPGRIAEREREARRRRRR